jgi:hypothetical protein
MDAFICSKEVARKEKKTREEQIIFRQKLFTV